MANSNEDESQDLHIVYKITHALEMSVELDPLYGWYTLKSWCTDENIDRSRLVELYGDLHLRLNIFFSIDKLLYTLLHSEAVFIPIKEGLGGSFCVRKIANPFYGLSKEAAAIKADLEGER